MAKIDLMAQLQAEAFKAFQLLSANAGELRAELREDFREFREYLESEEFECGIDELARRLEVSLISVDAAAGKKERIRAKVKLLFENSREELVEAFSKGVAVAGFFSLGKRKLTSGARASLVLGALFAVPTAGQHVLHILDIFLRKGRQKARVIPIKKL